MQVLSHLIDWAPWQRPPLLFCCSPWRPRRWSLVLGHLTSCVVCGCCTFCGLTHTTDIRPEVWYLFDIRPEVWYLFDIRPVTWRVWLWICTYKLCTISNSATIDRSPNYCLGTSNGAWPVAEGRAIASFPYFPYGRVEKRQWEDGQKGEERRLWQSERLCGVFSN